MWEHVRSHHQYTELREERDRHGYLRAKSATTGRWVAVHWSRIREIETTESLHEAERFVRREHLQHLAWALSRELPYNLGVAVTNIALWEFDGSLGVSMAALRDELERNQQTATQPPLGEQ